jgi:site-specific DNA-methyltransferase (adenine-specific)
VAKASVTSASIPDKASFVLAGRNPDVLTCIANLSNDEVFTPPELANRMLDNVAKAWADTNDGKILWSDKNATFLDPFTKSGVFLREITSRLNEGLKDEIPDLQDRVNHILTKQVFGIAITQLTAYIARRSLYCSKFANGPHSVVTAFGKGEGYGKADGHVSFERIEHEWNADATCGYCGASRSSLDRGDSLESHAYTFIHTRNIKARIAELFGEDMQFDVIVGNPPYQLDTGGSGRQATPIYDRFVVQAKRLEPRFLSMVIPARWFAGGMGLTGFRDEMLSDRRLRQLVDFILDKDAFPKVNVNGGICYFLWDRDHEGSCTITTVAPGGHYSEPVTRELDEFDIFVRRNEALPILRKVVEKGEPTFAGRVSSISPFGLPTKFHGSPTPSSTENIKLYGSGRVSWVNMSELKKNQSWVERWKILIPGATDGNENYPLPIWDKIGPFVSAPNEACTWTYLVASLADNEAEARFVRDYMQTKFFRFLVSLRKMTQHNKAENFLFAPDIPMDRSWTDEMLYERYAVTPDEQAFIDSIIRTMDFNGEAPS